jgi:hypothetical protein
LLSGDYTESGTFRTIFVDTPCSVDLVVKVHITDVAICLDYMKGRLRGFENRVLRRIFGPKRAEGEGG